MTPNARRFLCLLPLMALVAGCAVPEGRGAAQPLHGLAVIDATAGGWDYAAVDTVTNRLLVARADGVMAVELPSRRVVPQLVPGQHVHAVLPIPESRLVLSTNGDADTATLFDGRSGAIAAILPTGRKPDGALFDPASATVLVMNGKSGDVTMIDPRRAAVVGTIPVGGALEAAVADGAGTIYVNVEDRAELVVLDTRARAVTARYMLPGCDGPTGLGWAGDHRRLIVACANEVAKIVDVKTGAAVATLPIGAHPDAVIADPARSRAYISCGGSATLAVIDTSGEVPAGVANVATRPGARTGVLDPRTGRLYLPFGSLKPIAEFGVLVLGSSS